MKKEVVPRIAAVGCGELPEPFTEKYRPKTIEDFIGLEKPKEILTGLVAKPRRCALLFRGSLGLGKTAIAIAFAHALPAQLHTTTGKACTVDVVEEICRRCHFIPQLSEDLRRVHYHVVFVDDANELSHHAQLRFLPKFDPTAAEAQTIFVFADNASANLLDKFVDKCLLVEFTFDGMAEPLAATLENIWNIETSGEFCPPDFARIVSDANGNVRTALNRLELEVTSVLGRARLAGMQSRAPMLLVAADTGQCGGSKLAEIPNELHESPGIVLEQANSCPSAWEDAAAERAERIRSFVTSARSLIIEVGRELIAAKAEIPHGEWLRWLDREFRWSEATAQRYMRVAKTFGSLKSVSMTDLEGVSISGTALFALSSRDVDDSVRERAVEEALEGKKITLREAQQMIADHDRQIAERVADANEAREQFAADAAEGRGRPDASKMGEEQGTEGESISPETAAFWLWKEISLLEGRRLMDHAPKTLIAQMTEQQVADVLRIAPALIAWLQALVGERWDEEEWISKN